MAEPHQPPYSLQPPPPPQHQSMAPWYGMAPHMYQAQQAPAPPPQHHAVPWTVAAMPPPPGEPAYNYVSQPYHAPPQGDYYPRPQQVHHHYPPPPHPAQPQFTYMYGQQDQVWHQANNSWGYQQWPHPAQSASLSQEEVWAAKARAWAASKAVQDESRPTPNAPPIHQDYMFQPQEQGGQQHPLQPPGQEAAHSYPSSLINQGQSAQLRGQSEHPPQGLGYGQPTQEATLAITPESVLQSLEQKAAQAGGKPHSNDSQPMFGSSQVHDNAANYGLDASMTGSHGSDPQSLAKKPPAAPVYTQQAAHMLPQSQASPLISQPQLPPYSDKLAHAGYEQPSNYLQPPPPPPPPNSQQQPPAPVPHPPQKLPLQTHYQASSALEGVEGDFGLSPSALQNWAPVGGPGMPFPPAMGAGTSQFDPIHTPHQLPVAWRQDGLGLQGLGFPNSAPFGSPGLGPGVGPPVRPLFAPDTFVERPKKAAVPSWLREELMKKKAAGLTGNASGMLSSDEPSRVNGGDAVDSVGQRVGISDKLRSSTPGLSEDEEEDQEEEIEAARTAAINQEIKRLLTEVLLKVTGDLFKEIAQEVLDEDSADITQGTSSPDERSRVERLAPPFSPEEGPPPSGRVFVSSGKNPPTEDSIRDKESSDSGEAAGDVLGLGNYASDNETLDSRDKKEAPHGSSTAEEKTDSMTNYSADQTTVEESEDVHKVKIAEGPLQSKEPLHKMKGISEENIVRETSGKQDTTVHDVDVQNGRLPARRDLGASSTQVLTSTSKENTSPSQLASEQSSSKEKSILMSKGEGKSQDTLSRLLRGMEVAGDSSDASFKKLDDKETSASQGTLVKDRKREERREDRPKDLASKERKREDKPATESKRREERDDRAKAKSDTSRKERHGEDRMKDGEEMKRLRGSESRVRDSSRERRKEKEKLKEKSKPRERESDRDRKKQDKRERESRSSKRADGVEKKARHRSDSSSSRERSSSATSDRGRGRLDALRSSRHHTSISSPGGRSKKRRASRSRSRSRSPHVKHTHRRNVPSPSHEKSRRSGSKSPVHRRGRG